MNCSIVTSNSLLLLLGHFTYTIVSLENSELTITSLENFLVHNHLMIDSHENL